MTIGVVARAFNSVSILPEGMFEANINHIAQIADKISIIEGAADPPARPFTQDGHSTDGTVEKILELQKQHSQIELIQSPKGFWLYRNAEDMFRDLNKKMTTDYVWFMDGDEFYHEKDIPVIVKVLEERQPYMVEFYANQFWGDWNNRISDGTGHLWSNELPWQRIFKNSPNESYWHDFAPPTLVYKDGVVCNNQSNIITRNETRTMGINLYHYSFVKRSQVEFKHKFFKGSGWDYINIWDSWQKDHATMLPYGAVTEEFGPEGHPSVIKKLIKEEK